MPFGFEGPLKHLGQVFHLGLHSLLDNESLIFSSPADSLADSTRCLKGKCEIKRHTDYFLFEGSLHIWIFNVFEAVVSHVLKYRQSLVLIQQDVFPAVKQSMPRYTFLQGCA